MFNNFVSSYWSNQINTDLEKMLVFAEDCNREYDGKIKKIGDTVRILGVAKPTITTNSEKLISLNSAEDIGDTSVTMKINQVAWFNYKVDDIDARQAKSGILDALSKETTEGLGNVVDKYIANLALSNDAKTGKATVITKDNILKTIDNALTKLYEADVSPLTDIVLTVSPKFYMLLKEAYINLDRNNSDILKNGNVGKYGNITVKMSNNTAKSSDGSSDFLMLRTKRAIAYCNPITHTEAYRPENSFSDAVKGYILFDAKIVRPNEMIVINAKYK